MGMLKVSESQQFADRLRGALESAGVRALRYRGRSITPHTAQWRYGCPRITPVTFDDQGPFSAAKSHAQDGLGARH